MSQSTTILSLPDDLLVSCLASVSRLYYPTLSLVSKRFRSILASQELYKTRSSIGRTESCLYVRFGFYTDSSTRWFTLCRKPDQTLTKDKKKKKTTDYVLSAISPSQSPLAYKSSLVVVGPNIYNIGGPVLPSPPSSIVTVLDCRSNVWCEAPSMLVERNYPAATVLDGKIYVAGGRNDSMEVFDPKTQVWELVSKKETLFNRIGKIVGIDGKVYALGSNGIDLVYDPKEDKWENEGWQMVFGRSGCLYCVIDNVLYCYNRETFMWFDTTIRVWKYLRGLIKELLHNNHISSYCGRLVDYGGKMAILWEVSGYVAKKIFCAVVTLERRSDEQIWGNVDWHDLVLIVPLSYRLEHALCATV